MEKEQHTPERNEDNTERLFVTETLFDAMKQLAEHKGIDYKTKDPNLEFHAQDAFYDPATRLRHTYSFTSSYHQEIDGFIYHLSHAEEANNQFMYLDRYVQDQIYGLLQEKVINKKNPNARMMMYLKSIQYLRALESGEPVNFDGEGLSSLIRHTQYVETQYRASSLDCIITKKVIVQQKLDQQVISEFIYGAHSQDDVVLHTADENANALFDVIAGEVSYSNIEEDIPEMEKFLGFLGIDCDETKR
jgi:hypothetical protein